MVSLSHWAGFLLRRLRLQVSLPVCPHRENALWDHSRKATVRKQGGVSLLENKFFSILILDFEHAEVWENKYLLLTPPSQWYFAKSSLADQYSTYCPH